MKKKFAYLASLPALFAAQAQAAVPTEVTTAIETAGTDAKTVAAAVFVVIVGIFAIKLLRRGL